MGSGCPSSIPPPPFTSHETLGSYFIFPWLTFLILQKAGFLTVLGVKLMFCTSTAQKLINLQLHGFLICPDTSKVLRGTLVMCSHIHMFLSTCKSKIFWSQLVRVTSFFLLAISFAITHSLLKDGGVVTAIFGICIRKLKAVSGCYNVYVICNFF